MACIDARHIHRQVDRAHRNWTDAQIGFIANLVRLYRGEALDTTFGGDAAAAKINEMFGNTPAYADVAGLCKAATLEEDFQHQTATSPQSRHRGGLSWLLAILLPMKPLTLPSLIPG